MKIVFISGPYTGKTKEEVEKNIKIAKSYAEKYWKLGFIVICPHTNSAHMDNLLPYPQWIRAYLRLVEVSDIIVMLPNWESSSGARMELFKAKRSGLEVIYEKPFID